jgi:hypothetical protein
MKAIETKYKGRRFRSRLEARWAVFFDAMGFKWEYEPEGYAKGGIAYLPDFLLTLPNGKQLYCEVKPEEYHFSDDPRLKFYRELVNTLHKPFVMLTGLPQFMVYDQIAPNLPEDSFHAVFFLDYEPYLRVADSYWFPQLTLNEHNGHLYFPHDERAAQKSFGKKFVEAVYAASSARFEFGESGGI